MFGIVTLVAVTVFTISYPYISDQIFESKIRIAEVQMSLLDYVASRASLGDSPSQSISFNLLGGSLSIESGGNNITIIGVFNGTEEKVIYSSSIGRVVFRIGDVVIGYEGGGVWLKRSGKTVMVSPPEFHYKIDTLTFPIIKIDSSASIAGSGVVDLSVKRVKITKIYPDPSKDPRFVNPLECDYLIVKVTSEFWDGWMNYFEERSDAEVRSIDAENNTVTFELAVKSAPVFKTYEMPIRITRLNYSDEEPIKEFVLNLYELRSNYKLVWYTDTDPALVIYMQKRQGSANEFILRVYYGNESKYESWESNTTLKWNDDGFYSLDFLNESIWMEYKKPDAAINVGGVRWPTNAFSSVTWTWGNDINETDFVNDQLGDFNEGKVLTLKNVTEHYFRVLAAQTSPDIVIYEGRADGFNTAQSTYRLLVDQMPPIITYLHVVEHTVKIY